MLDNEIKHPSMAEIMEFVCLTKEELKPENYTKHFGMVAHLVKCAKCSMIKERMEEFVEFFDKSLDAAAESNLDMFRVFCSLGELDKIELLKKRQIILNVKAKISKEAGKSKIFTCGSSDNILNEDVYTDERNNKILLMQEKVNVIINDNEKEELSLLMMSCNEGKEPIFKDMERNGESWEVSCDCPEDEYDIVVL